MGLRALYKRSTRLFEELTLARADGTYGKLLDRLAKIDVLIIDDRTGQRSTVITSQLPTSRWHDRIGDPTVADAVCDRLLHTAHRLALKGPSRRKPVGPEAEATEVVDEAQA